MKDFIEFLELNLQALFWRDSPDLLVNGRKSDTMAYLVLTARCIPFQVVAV
jgi:hypothetical protein